MFEIINNPNFEEKFMGKLVILVIIVINIYFIIDDTIFINWINIGLLYSHWSYQWTW